MKKQTKSKSVVEVKPQNPNFYIRMNCGLCGNSFKGNGGELFVNGQYILDVCDVCVKKSPQELVKGIKDNVERLKSNAQYLSNLSKEDITIDKKAFEDYEAKVDREMKEWEESKRKDSVMELDKESNIKIGSKFRGIAEVSCTQCGAKCVEDVEFTKTGDMTATAPKFICANCKARNELLEKAKTKGVNRRVSYDCHIGVEPGDDIVRPDKDGDSLFKHSNLELCNFDGVRLQFSPETNVTDILRAIDKIRAWIVEETNQSYKRSNECKGNDELDNIPF